MAFSSKWHNWHPQTLTRACCCTDFLGSTWRRCAMCSKRQFWGEKNWDTFLDVLSSQWFGTSKVGKTQLHIDHQSSIFSINYGNLSCKKRSLHSPKLSAILPTNKRCHPRDEEIDRLMRFNCSSPRRSRGVSIRFCSVGIRRSATTQWVVHIYIYMIKLQFSLSSVFQSDQNLASNHKRSLNWLLSF